MTRKQVQEQLRLLPNIKGRWVGCEWRIAYKGLKSDREEAMAYYTNDAEDAVGTARIMQRDYQLVVFECDKIPVREIY